MTPIQSIIVLTGRARDYLHRRRASAVHVTVRELLNSCIPFSPPPLVFRGPPAKPERFFSHELEGITVYLDRKLASRGSITIDAYGIGFLSWLTVVDSPRERINM